MLTANCRAESAHACLTLMLLSTSLIVDAHYIAAYLIPEQPIGARRVPSYPQVAVVRGRKTTNDDAMMHCSRGSACCTVTGVTSFHLWEVWMFPEHCFCFSMAAAASPSRSTGVEGDDQLSPRSQLKASSPSSSLHSAPAELLSRTRESDEGPGAIGGGRTKTRK